MFKAKSVEAERSYLFYWFLALRMCSL